MDPRGFPTTLPEFQRVFPDDAACARYLEHLRWPNGFTCPKCVKLGEPYRFPKLDSVFLGCRACHANVSLTATTVMKSSRTPLSVWFWGAYLVTTQTPGQSADSKDNSVCLATNRRFNCSPSSAPVWCDRSATLSAINIRLKWMKRLWVGEL